MMSALQAGGMELLIDHIRTADANNPKGYYEFERVKQLPKSDYSWLRKARGKGVKIISALLEFLPEKFNYKVIFMQREMNEILSSQARMLERSGKENEHPVSDEAIRHSYQEHLNKVTNYLAAGDWFQTLYVSYNDILAQPDLEFKKVVDFLGVGLDLEKMTKMVDPNLYREKR